MSGMPIAFRVGAPTSIKLIFYPSIRRNWVSHADLLNCPFYILNCMCIFLLAFIIRSCFFFGMSQFCSITGERKNVRRSGKSVSTLATSSSSTAMSINALTFVWLESITLPFSRWTSTTSQIQDPAPVMPKTQATMNIWRSGSSALSMKNSTRLVRNAVFFHFWLYESGWNKNNGELTVSCLFNTTWLKYLTWMPFIAVINFDPYRWP